MQTAVAVQWDIYMQHGGYICSWAYAINVKSMYTCAISHIVTWEWRLDLKHKTIIYINSTIRWK